MKFIICSFSLACLLLFHGSGLQAQKEVVANLKVSLDKWSKTLDKQKRARVFYDFDDQRREEWSFLPYTMVKRPGIQLKELDEDQKMAVSSILQACLSATGYDKVKSIIELEVVLFEMEGNIMRDPDQYYVAIFGNPLVDDAWTFSFEGHHISLNYTIVKDRITASPIFLGSNPAEIQIVTKKGLRVLSEEEDLAFLLLESLNSKQLKKGLFRTDAVPDVVTAMESKVAPLEDVGLRYADLSTSQQGLFDDLLAVYVHLVNKEMAMIRLKKMDTAGRNDIRFAWAGAKDKSGARYYRIQGPHFLIEFDNFQNNANHIHTVWREFEGDFGRDLLAEHYKSMH